MFKTLAAGFLSLGLVLAGGTADRARAEDKTAEIVFGGLLGLSALAIIADATRPVYVAPRPVYRRPVYVAPRPYYYAPRPVYVAPRPYYVAPRVVYRRPVYVAPRPYYRPYAYKPNRNYYSYNR
jgi:hypothetical protein